MFTPLHAVASALIPRRCASCETPLSYDELNWCGPCEFSWIRHTGHSQQRFGGRLDWRFQWSWLRLATAQESRLVHALKYGGDPTLGLTLGATMAREFNATHSHKSFKNWNILPVPLHRRRFRKRGYNQSTQLAKGWSSVTGMRVTGLLERNRSGQSFTRFNRSQRIAHNPVQFDWRGGIKYPPPLPEGFVILDDVVTTGSTLESMHQAMRKHWDGPMAFITMADATQ